MGVQETLGWNFTGLIVPGYLASILVIQPVTGAVVVAEAVVTWLCYTALADKIPRWWPWSPLFGRDRFFGLLLISVGVRVLLEGGGFDWLQENLGIAVQVELHSMSLVVVPLAANAIWRTGFFGAISRVGIPVLITWAIVDLVLLRHTNLSLASFELTYEDIALDFVSSPRAYILLLTGAWLGSAANIRWGWDYGGIIVPGLLSVCWLDPTRLVATLVEGALIAGALRLAVKLPGLRGANLTGGRPLVLAFCLGYALKFALGFVLGSLWPGLEVRELLGFGYLLPTMIALRVIRAGDDVFRPIVPAVVTSFAAFVLGTAAGYVLAVLLPVLPPAPAPLPDAGRADITLAMHAWANRGDVPDALALHGIAADEERIYPGGDGFGALWVRPGRSDLVVTATVGPPGMPAALAAIADVVDARGVFLCAAPGPTCEGARRDLARMSPMLRVIPAERTALRVAGALPAQVRTPELAAILGPVPLEVAGLELTLQVSPAALARAGAAGVGVAPPPVDPARMAEPLAGGEPPDPGLLRVLAEEVVGPLDAWRRREPWADDALRVAAGNAAALGMEVTATGDRAVLAGPRVRLILDRRGIPGVVHQPDHVPGGRAGRATRVVWQALGYAALVEDAAEERDEGAAEADGAAFAVILGLLERLEPGAPVVTLRSMRPARPAGADLVLSNGRPVLQAEEPAVFAPLRALAGSLGATVASYDGSIERAWLADSGNALRGAVHASSDQDAQVTVFLSPQARDRLAPQGLWVGLPEVPVDVVALAATAQVPGPGWDDALASAARYARSGDARELAGLRGTEPVLLRDDLLGVRWLRISRCDPDCTALVIPLGAPDGVDPEPTPLASLALGTLAWEVE